MGKKAVKKSAAERPWCAVTDMDQYLFGEGTHYEIYKKLGAHPAEVTARKVSILQYGRPMPKTYAWSENSTAGVRTDIR